MTKLVRLARSLQDAMDSAHGRTKKGIALNFGVAVDDSTDPVGRLLANVLEIIEEI